MSQLLDRTISAIPPRATALTLPLLVPLADAADDHHHGWGWGDGWWIVMVIGMIAFWALVIGAAVWLAREYGPRRRAQGAGSESALELLDRRLAEGAMSVEEYERRRELLLRGRGGEAEAESRRGRARGDG